MNFITCHDGFPLWDLYCYNGKHNLANGWNNTDGANDNNSWNCGAEGETEDPAVNELRRRMCRNAFALLMCSRGTPMFLAGDEFCNTQFGNNNAYCQDNIISWLDWSRLEPNRDMFNFFRFMIRFRKEHRVLRTGTGDGSCGFPEVSFHGVTPWRDRPFEGHDRYVGVMFSGWERDIGSQVVYVASNAWWEDLTVTLPQLPASMDWVKAVDTWTAEQSESPVPGLQVTVRARSVMVFVAK